MKDVTLLTNCVSVVVLPISLFVNSFTFGFPLKALTINNAATWLFPFDRKKDDLLNAVPLLLNL